MDAPQSTTRHRLLTGRLSTGRLVTARAIVRWRLVRRRLWVAAAIGAALIAGRAFGASAPPPSSSSSSPDTVSNELAVAESTATAPEGAPRGRFGVGADERLIALAPPLSPLPLESGDLVELHGIRADPGADRALVGPVIGESARVVSADQQALVIVVAEADVEAVLAHDAVGTLAVVATGQRASSPVDTDGTN